MLLHGAVALALTLTPPATGSDRPVLDWGECPDNAAVQCADLRLPVDWSRPDGETFELAVARRPAPDPAKRIGTLVFGPGGPGDSGVGKVLDGTRFSPEILERFDVVSFDPRTVEGSAAPVCEPDPDLPPPPIVLRDQADFDATVRWNRALWARCRASSPVFDHASTLDTVRDIEALRRALGEPSLTFHGSSYGTLLGQQYAERHPHRVRAVVLEGVFDHGLDLRGFVRTQAAALQDAFDEFLAWCDATGQCGEDIRGEWAKLGDLERSVLPLMTLNGPDRPRLAALIRRYAAGQGPPITLPPIAAGAFCADFPAPVRDYREYASLLREAAQAGPEIRYGAGVAAISTCLGWPKPVTNPPHRLRVRTGIPLLLLNARHDPRTGLNWATRIAAELGRHGRLVTYEGAGHGVYRDTPCTGAVVDRYLIDLTVPPPGTTCPAP
ncbi:alpha/beta hydrolase [Actinoplanes hulinensis]|uniref:Alpha/beta hydrolase n=1 Tax=Actinoplanes hulinensis TaxID=1144547 RepID=A0ABS7B5T9_9ACTN|nr:alpha/beta hydrolase [Actinoplanes hulinensis]MBW6436267.1 alpha/beta hydrolase [Actinoplanes hulinensis]